MKTSKRRRLEAAGWIVGSAADLLALSDEDVALIEIRHALAVGLRERREDHGLTQVELAERLGSSQSRVAKMEAADPSVTLDLLIRALLDLGATHKELARLIGRAAA